MTNIVEAIREKFHPLTRYCGPLFAGEVSFDNVCGQLYLDELSNWIWMAKSIHSGVLSDEQVGDVVSPHFLVRNLLASIRVSMDDLIGHLGRIEQLDGDTSSLLRYYLEDSSATIVDGIALRSILAPRMSERTQ